jgi:hypothetical protein
MDDRVGADIERRTGAVVAGGRAVCQRRPTPSQLIERVEHLEQRVIDLRRRVAEAEQRVEALGRRCAPSSRPP